MDARARSYVIPGILVAAMALVAASLVLGTLRRPELPAYAPTPPAPMEAGTSLVGPRTVTVDARDDERWAFFDFSRGTVTGRPDPLGWDLAFRRHEIVANGGGDLPGRGGIRPIEAVPFDSVAALPAAGYTLTETDRDTVNPAIHKWYDYGFTTHLLTPRPIVWAIRTADGRYAKMEILSYYCTGAVGGCLTFRYVYQGDGSRDVTSSR